MAGPVSNAAEHTFVFADLAGYTALTEAHGDEQAADLVSAFVDSVRAVLSDHGAEEVNVIGDAILLRCADAGEAVRLAVRIVTELGARHGFPGVRAGMHTGPAVGRGGDWFGTTVNVAARVTGEASAGEVLITAATRRVAGEPPDVEIHARGRRELRNVTEPVELFAALRAGESNAERLPIDPVCRMAVDPAHGAGSLIHEGVEYRFCSLDCASAFAARPDRYTRS